MLRTIQPSSKFASITKIALERLSPFGLTESHLIGCDWLTEKHIQAIGQWHYFKDQIAA